MDIFHKRYHKVASYTAVTIFIAIGLWVASPLPIYAGFILGAIVSMINSYILYREVVGMTETRKFRLVRVPWMGIRFALVIAVAVYADKSNFIHLYTTIFGAFFSQIVAYVYFFIDIYTTKD